MNRPVHISIRDDLRMRLNAGEWPVGERLPSEIELSARYGVARMTIRQAIGALASEGAVIRRQGLGTFAADGRPTRTADLLLSFAEEMRRQGRQVETRLISAAVEAVISAFELVDVLRELPMVRQVMVAVPDPQIGDGEAAADLEGRHPGRVGLEGQRDQLVDRREVAREALKNHDLGDAGDALDQRAQGDYRRRLRELAEELAEAERFNDRGNVERLRRELEFLNGELSAALGSGGRNRRAASHVERARGMVSKNIRAGLEKMRSEDPEMGRHFAASIRTGYYCAYLPDPDREISWRL